LIHLPARLVERADGGCRQGEVVGQEHQRLAGLGILEADATQMLGVVLAAGNVGERDGLVADNARAAIHLGRIDPPQWVFDLARVTKKACA